MRIRVRVLLLYILFSSSSSLFGFRFAAVNDEGILLAAVAFGLSE